MPTEKKEIDLENPKEMKRLMIALRNSIQDYLDNIDMEEADKAKAKKKDKEKE